MATLLSRVWVAGPPNAGTLNQCLGVFDALRRASAPQVDFSRDPKVNQRRDRLLCRLPVIGRWLRPDLLISCAAAGEDQALRIAGRGRPARFWVHGEVPRRARRLPDLVFVPFHDWRAEFEGLPNFMRIHGVPHRVHGPAVVEAREPARRRLGIAEARVAVVLVGGRNRAYLFDDASENKTVEAVAALAADGWRVLVSASRRTPEGVRGRLAALALPQVGVWAGAGANPYRDYLAAADAFLVTGDSISMTCEAVACGKPVYTLGLTPRFNGRWEKFNRFHDHLSLDLGATRAFEGKLTDYAVAPFEDAAAVAARTAGLVSRP